MKRKIVKSTLTILLALLMVMIVPASIYAEETPTENEGDVSGNDPGESDDPGWPDVPSPRPSDGFEINFIGNAPEGCPLDIARQLSGSMEHQSVEFSDVTAGSARLNANQYVLPYYEFKEWKLGEPYDLTFSDNASLSELDGRVTKDYILNLEAIWEPKVVKVIYFLDEGINSASNLSEYTVENFCGVDKRTKPVTLAAGKKTGLVFGGWFKDAEFTQPADTLELSDITEALDKQVLDGSEEATIELYARWDNVNYNIKFNANGGQGSMTGINNIGYEKPVNLPAASFTRKGMSFSSWNTKADGTGLKIANKATVSKLATKDGATVTLYAQWKYTSYKITYKNMSSAKNNSANPSKYTMQSKKITFKDPKRTGYIFKGWYKDSAFKKAIKSIASGSTGNVTIYAKWEPIKYNVAFNANGGKGKMQKISGIAYNKKFKLTKNKFTKEGYYFAGWNTKKNGSGESYADGSKVSGLTSKNKGTKTLYAQWEPVTYKIKFNGNGATSGKMSTLTKLQYSKTYKLTPNAFKRTGYKFMGWNTQKDGKGIGFKDGAKVTKLCSENGKTITLYAKWLKVSGNNYSAEQVFNILINNGSMTAQGAAGLLGNLKAESDLRSNNLQNTYNESLRMTDEEYTDAVDSGEYTNFVYDSAGYGLAQWTSAGRKQKLLEYAQAKEVSIGDYDMQLEFLIDELAYSYSSVYEVLKTTKSVKAASNSVLIGFEKPRDQSKAAQERRAAIGTKYFKQFRPNENPEPTLTMNEEDCPFIVVTSTAVRVRKGPGTNNDQIGTIGQGERCKIIHVSAGGGSSKGWGQVESNGSAWGWVALDFVTRVE